MKTVRALLAAAVLSVSVGPAVASAAAATAVAADASAKAEQALRKVIADGQAGTVDYSVFDPNLASAVRQQEAQAVGALQGFGAVKAVTYGGLVPDAPVEVHTFKVEFENAATEWMIGFGEDGLIQTLFFRPAR